MDTIGKIDKSIRRCYYRITRQWCIYITCVYSIFNTSRRIYDLLRVMLNWWRIYGDANNLATIIYRTLFRLVEETGNAEECIIVTRFSEILNFQAVKLSEGEGGQRSRTCILDLENVTFTGWNRAIVSGLAPPPVRITCGKYVRGNYTL